MYSNDKRYLFPELVSEIASSLDCKDKVSLRSVNRELKSLLSPVIYFKVDEYKTEIWYKEGKIHRAGDEPAVICSNGDILWYKEGKLHRDGDEPTIIRSNGDRLWYKEGKRHRDGDGPAVIWSSGTRAWYKEGEVHRDGDEPAVIWYNGNRFWYKEGIKIKNKIK